MPAVVVGGAIAAAGAVGGAALSSSAQKKAANKAAAAQQDATAQNNALAREQYGLNQAALAPWQQRGNTAGAAMNALLGLGGSAPTVGAQPASSPQYGNTPTGGYMAPGNSMWGSGGMFNGEPINGLSFTDGNQYAPQPQYAAANVTTQAAPQTAQQDYENAFANYRNSTGYEFRVGEGQRAINTGFAGKGALNSGAAMKAMAGYQQNIASGEFGNYLNQLFGVSNQGLSAANAQAGVGSSLVNAITNNNNNAADAASNAALLRGQANGNLYAGIGSALGNLGGTFASSFGSSSALPGTAGGMDLRGFRL